MIASHLASAYISTDCNAEMSRCRAADVPDNGHPAMLHRCNVTQHKGEKESVVSEEEFGT
jgi:hypothetical protein